MRFSKTRSLIGAGAALVLFSPLVVACDETSDAAIGVDENKEVASNLSGQQGTLTGEGATSQQKAMEYFGATYRANVDGARLDYTATGSGSGQKQFIAGTVAFGGSDSPLKEEQKEAAKERCGGNDAWHLPLVIGPVAVAYRLDGVDDVVLSPTVIAQIFSGKITSWDDAAIKDLNPDVELPAKPITVVYRSEESGTSDNFQRFLKSAAPDEWTTTGKSFPTATGAGANGSTGVVAEAAGTDGGITYVEAGFVADYKDLRAARIDFGSGPVELNPDTVGKALGAIAFDGDSHDMEVDSSKLFAMNEQGAYPLVLTTYEIVCSKGYSETDRALVKDFLTVALSAQDEGLAELGYIPVSGEFKTKLEAAVEAIS